jgi:hypothetical protein
MARFKRTQPPRPPAGRPASPKEGAAAILKATVKLYDRQDGEGVDWRLIAETLFLAAFDVLDRLPDDQKKAVARRVHAGAYDRTAGNPIIDSAPSKTGPVRAGSSPSNTADF